MNAVLDHPIRHDGLGTLRDKHLFRELGYVEGRWVAGEKAETFSVLDPATGQRLARVTSLGEAETALAIDAAVKAFPSWRDKLPQERSAVLRRWFELVTTHREDLALLMTLEQGKPLAESRGEIDYGASFIEWFAEEAKRLNGETIASHLQNAEMLVRREALGVVALVTPWNFPHAMITRKAAAAIAAGCPVVVHPSSETPLSALALAELAERAGMPAGIFNVVTGKAAPIVDVLCRDERVRGLSFTGSTEIGKLIATKSANTMKRLVMELGGHAPLIIFDDADVERAVDVAMAAKFATSGQDCLAANRIFVQRGILKSFTEAFATRIAALKVGNGLDPASDIGPLMHSRAVAKVEEQVLDAKQRGARIVTGGNRLGEAGLFFEPTLLVDVPDDAAIMREETFGPVAAVTAFDDEDEVVARANATQYGLVAYVVTANGARQLRMGRVLEYGMVAINRAKITGAPIPFGGWKQSGLGREGSHQGIEAFTEIKYLCIDTAA
ncbi:NAD-dependent succinate-semialdehyde dehydrogenase [Brucella intermedia]|uniref:NAD-dependent succinate-semialdehyde dehydrogenase n=1 Tax=Brucella intermedia GD04153 TaxID=2975438 RepID=A0AA42H1C8_9HYPH|nr:NAD-dependent succinate-semialdehyde dehydrogenase [Brucella intermedia]ERI15631.1 aldehyde dehydrogenase [Ochrobactrum sp. EGD-AQ16]PJT21655.1 NAD-dependent succinate-semialdehyde dehydrogenase [Ochrobactrum sp. 30A/1000/2015]PJT39740.1 NAD-dependent succinate-semialdehyde dehydrogenase [Ochrobactrum sp. 27A/999/2015]PJT44034.1 NAD-dependent succinate-semialdehyde dehydrogenase [Ochrobactrum sp. 23A/997/2015]KAB2709541.1 NAD-dependent succinate-semialdehyde dehydrogenase [Brucella intermed